MTRLQLGTNISTDFLTHVEQELALILTQRSVMQRDRIVASKTYSFLYAIVKLLCAFGLALSLLALVLSRRDPRMMLIFAFFGLIFGLGLIVFWDKEKVLNKLSTFNVRFSTWLAGKMAGRMLKAATRLAPFVAEYDFRGNSVVYYRTKDESTKIAWVRSVCGLRMTGSGFTLFFKKETTVYPHMIVLHDASAEWEAYLDGQGIQPIQQQPRKLANI